MSTLVHVQERLQTWICCTTPKVRPRIDSQPAAARLLRSWSQHQSFFSICRDPCCNLSTRISTGILQLLVFFFGIGDATTMEGAIPFHFRVTASSDLRKVAPGRSHGLHLCSSRNCLCRNWCMHNIQCNSTAVGAGGGLFVGQGG
jgi:hypothetical protein